jgi:outer membrane immunogenic protein
MKKLFMGLVAGLAFASVASSAVLADNVDWSGPYIGAIIGHGSATGNSTCVDGSQPCVNLGVGYSISPDGFTGGMQAGYNLQVGRYIIAGIEADFSKSWVSDSYDGTGLGAEVQSSENSIEWLGTVRGRLGVAAGPLLFYGTAGVAYAKMEDRYSFFERSQPETMSDYGLTYGGGAELSLSENWSVKAEYLKVYLDSSKLDIGYTNYGTDGQIFARFKHDLNNVRLGVSYRF